MTIKSVLVLVDDDTVDSRRALQCGFELACRFSAHMTGLHIRNDPLTSLPYITEGMSPMAVEGLVDSLSQRDDERARRAHTAFNEIVERPGFLRETDESGTSATSAWVEEAGLNSVVASERARVSDLVILSHAIENQTDSMREVLDAVLFDSGAPLLLVPPFEHKLPGRRIGIGWNKGTLASRAVRNAMPFLELADEIVVFQIETGAKSGPSADDLAAFLALHDVTAGVRRLIPDRLSVAERLLAEATNAELDMLVMGAYSHSRLAQMVLGGVTHEILSRAELPILLSH